MDYTQEDYKADLSNPEMPHTKSRERFQAFYNELGKQEVQLNQSYQTGNMSFIEPKGKILELGCHWGFDLIHWATQGFECVGIDVSETLVEYGRKKIAELPNGVKEKIAMICCFIEDFQPTEKYDTIVLTETLEHVIDPIPVLMKAKECLGSNGTIYISTPSKRTGTFSHVRGINNDEMEALINKCGFRAIKWPGNDDETKVIAKHI